MSLHFCVAAINAQDMMSLLGLRERFKPRYAAMRAAAKAKQQSVTAAAAAVAAAPPGTSLAAAVASASAAAKPAAAALNRRLKEQMLPTTDAAVMARVGQELSRRGGFTPLMHLMPMDPQPCVSIPWDERDFELRRLMAAGTVGAVGNGGASSGEGGAVVSGADSACPEEPADTEAEAGWRRRGSRAGGSEDDEEGEDVDEDDD